MSNSIRETTVVDSPRSERAKSGVFIFGFLPALAVAFFVFAIGLVSRPPEYVARATFVVDWNEMATVFGDDEADKLRAFWRKEIIATTTALPDANQLADLLDPGQKLGDDDRAALIAQAQNQLRVTLASEANDQDTFLIEFRAHNAAQAQDVANGVRDQKISHLNNEALAGRLAAIGQSKKNLDDVDKQRESGDRDSSDLDSQEIQAGLSLMGNTFGIALTPVKRVGKVQVENRIASHVIRVLFAGLFFGCVTGIGGLGFRKIISPRRTPKARADAVPPKLPSLSVPPLMAQFDIPKPPVLPR